MTHEIIEAPLYPLHALAQYVISLHPISYFRLSTSYFINGCDRNRHEMTLGVGFWRRYCHCRSRHMCIDNSK